MMPPHHDETPTCYIPGDARPLRALLADLMPARQALQDDGLYLDSMAAAMGRAGLTVEDLDQQLGGKSIAGQAHVHSRYWETFRTLFNLDRLDLSDGILLEAQMSERERTLRDSLRASGFDWLAAQADSRCHADISSITAPDKPAPNPPTLALQICPPDDSHLWSDPVMGFAPAGLPPAPPEPTELPIGTRLRLRPVLPWPGHVLMVSRHPSESGFALYCLNEEVGCPRAPLSAGCTLLPQAIAIKGPEGVAELLMILSQEALIIPPTDRALNRAELTNLAEAVADRPPRSVAIALVNCNITKPKTTA